MALISLCCSNLSALKCFVPCTTTLSNLLYVWWMARVLLLPWYSFGRRPTKAVSPLSLVPLPQNNYLPTVLCSKMSGLKLSHQWWEFYKRPVKTSVGRPSEDLPLMGREESEVWITSCINAGCNHTSVFYSTFGAELPATLVCSFDATNSQYFGGMPPSMHTINGVET